MRSTATRRFEFESHDIRRDAATGAAPIFRPRYPSLALVACWRGARWSSVVRYLVDHDLELVDCQPPVRARSTFLHSFKEYKALIH
jgi:hypothetical protein